MTAAPEGTGDAVVECWCCGGEVGAGRAVRLGNHPEVALCVGCAHWAHLQGREIEDRDREGTAVELRDFLRRRRQSVIRRGWHRHPVVGPLLRRVGRHLP